MSAGRTPLRGPIAASPKRGDALLEQALGDAINPTASPAPLTLREREALLMEKESFLIQEKKFFMQQQMDFHRERLAFEEEKRLLREANGASPAAALSHDVKHGRTKDPMDDVPALVAQFQERGGQVPLGVNVAQVAALQQAATRLNDAAASCDNQIKQLQARSKLDLTPWRRRFLNQELDELTRQRNEWTGAAKGLLGRFLVVRDTAIQRFTPLLMETVQKYDSAFESHLDPTSEKALDEIGEMSKTIKAKGRDLRQPLPTSLPATDLHTLMRLLALALQAHPRLRALAEEMVVGLDGVQVVTPPHPVKGIMRCLQKAQEEYEGDYTRILDLSRITVVFDSIVELKKALGWLLSSDRAPHFVTTRIKDRLSRDFDAEMSGGNRDVMLNGTLLLGGGREIIVEIQLHLRCLYELKSDLHVLYAGARVLGAMEDTCAKVSGIVTDALLKRVRQGVVRKMYCSFSELSEKQVEEIGKILRTDPCPLLQVDLAYCKKMGGKQAVFDGLTLSEYLIGAGGPGKSLRTFACRNLRYLNFVQCGLEGGIPIEIGRCVNLVMLDLAENRLTGAVPEEIGGCRRLKKLNLNGNDLSGLLPESLADLTVLRILRVCGNPRLMVTGPVKAKIAKTVLKYGGREWNDMQEYKNKAPGGPQEELLSGTGIQILGVAWCRVVGAPEDGDVDDSNSEMARLRRRTLKAVESGDFESVRKLAVEINALKNEGVVVVGGGV